MKNKIYKNLHFYSILFFAIFPFIPNRLKGLPVILLFLVSSFLYVKEKKRSYPFKKVFRFSTLYLVLLLSLINTTNFSGIDKTLSTGLSLLIIPISIGLLYSIKESFSYVLLLNYTKINLIVTSFYSLSILFYFNKLGVFSNEISLYDALAYITNEMWLINQHPIYASIFIALPILLTIYFWLLLKRRSFITFTLPLVVINLLTLLVLERKGVIVSFLLSLLVLFFCFLKQKKSKRIVIGFVLAFFVTSFVLSTTSNRFKELYNIKNYTGELKFNSTSLRFGIYNCVISKIKESPLFGFGLGDVQEELEKCYLSKSKLLLELKHNSHNQYLSYFLSSGISGFLLLFVVMIKTLIDGIQNKNIVLLIITVFFAVCMMFENILERQSGVILFSFYICILSFYNFKHIKFFKDI